MNKLLNEVMKELAKEASLPDDPTEMKIAVLPSFDHSDGTIIFQFMGRNIKLSEDGTWKYKNTSK